MKTPMGKNNLDRLIPRLIEELQAIQHADPQDVGILRPLYDGELNPAEKGFSHISGYNEIVHDMAESTMEMRRLTENDPKMREAYETYCDTRNQMDAIESYELFAQGFGLAIRLIIDGIGKG